MSARGLFARGLLLVTLFALLAWALGDVIDREWIDAQVRAQGVQGHLLFLAAACLLMSVGLSRQFIAVLAGYGFGFQAGLLLAMAAVVAACILTYSAARLWLNRYLAARLGERVRRVRDFVHDNTFAVTLLFRLLPLGSNWMLNVAAGMSGFRPVPFFTASALGYLPQMIIFALIGSGVAVEQPWQVAIAVALGVLALLLALSLYRHYRLQERQPATGRTT